VAAVLVHIDLDGDRPHPSSLVALAAGRHVASSWGATLYAALIVHDPDERASADSTAQVASAGHVPGIGEIEAELARSGADKIVVALTDAPIVPLWATLGGAWQGVLDHLRPRVVLFGADSPSAPELAPRTGARIGARLFGRARVIEGDDVELRDRDGGYARIGDSGAAVALIGQASPVALADEDIDVVVLALPGGADPRIELADTSRAELAHGCGALIVLGDDVAGDPALVASARQLAALLDAPVVASPSAARAAALPAGHAIERSTPLAPALCVAVGDAQVDVAGATSLIRIGAQPTRQVDGALPGLPAKGVAELVRRLEEP
jgi:electron transfer flavoprotein alpha subunit